MTLVLGGSELASRLRFVATVGAGELIDRGLRPHLAVVVVAGAAGGGGCVRSLADAAERSGLDCPVHELGPADPAVVRSVLRALSAAPHVHGIVLRSPLPGSRGDGVRAEEVASAVDPAKDVEGAAPLSRARLEAGLPAFAPVAAAAAALLEQHGVARRRAVPAGAAARVDPGADPLADPPGDAGAVAEALLLQRTVEAARARVRCRA